MNEVAVPERKKDFSWLYDLFLIVILVAAAFFRLRGSNWGQLSNQHPDENFMSSVVYSIQPVHSLSQYFNTGTSTLNPANVGQGAYVYGTLPLFGVRYLGDLFKVTDYKLFGRQMAALVDLGSVAMLYFLVKRLYKRRVALLAAAFSAMAVMQIQQSHFFTTDSFVTFFIVLTLYFAVLIATGKWEKRPAASPLESESPVRSSFLQKAQDSLSGFFNDSLTYLCLGFGISLGMAAASKINAVVMAVMLPVTLLVRYYNTDWGKPAAGEEKEDRWQKFGDFVYKAIVFLAVGAVISLITFRILQPYAFSGPGFFGVKLNPSWLQKIHEQVLQTSPNSDLPWDLQWARRTHLFSFQNLTVWGLGLPLGILAWAGFLWMAWRMLRGEWRQHLVLWLWTAGYFAWQSLQYNATMRYELPIYPTLAMMAAWLVIWVWDKGRLVAGRRVSLALRFGSAVIGGIVLLLTLAWAYAFSSVYVQPESRIAASEWIFQNVAAPINLQIKTASGAAYRQPLSFLNSPIIGSNTPYEGAFTAQQDGTLQQVFLPHVTDHALAVSISQDPSGQQPLAVGRLLVTPNSSEDTAAQELILNQQPSLAVQQNYFINVTVTDPSLQLDLCGPLALTIQGSTSPFSQTVDPGANCQVTGGQAYQIPFTAQADGPLSNLSFSHIADISRGRPQSLIFTLKADQVSGTASASASFAPTTDPRGNSVSLNLDHPLAIKKGIQYSFRLDTTGGGLVLSAATLANETDYDYTLPFPTVYNGFPDLYRGELNLQVYWDDNPNKLARFENILDQTDYLLIPTNHQYGQITRIPERYPLTTAYYRDLIGCPADKDIIWCYRHAEPGMFHGTLGYDLVATFEDYPTIGSLRINDQAAEEAFTFYDHPKVFVFKKNADYSPANVQALLGSVDTSAAIHLTPGQADHFKSTMLSTDALTAQQAGGTWSDLFNRNAFYNRYPVFGLIIWYLVIFLLGAFTYPLVRAALPGLADHGYPLARVAGLLLWAWLAWIAGSVGLTYNRGMIALTLGVIVLLGLWQAWRQRQELRQELRTRWKYFLMVEILFLGFFLVDLLIRFGNPDLWHPSKGGERPMDFAYFNAVLKSTSFPPYDPWFAGGYINYYYYGYVIVGTPVKLLGIVPSIAYNFILPTLYACLALASFSVGWDLLAGFRKLREPEPVLAAAEGELPSPPQASAASVWAGAPFIAGLSAAAAMVLIGNLGIVRMLYQGFQDVVASGNATAHANIFLHFIWAVEGFFKTLVGGAHLPYGPGDWYWNPSRIYPDSAGSAITEFPLFTFIYSDLHAHMIALMVTVLAISWSLSVLLAKARWKNWVDAAGGLFLGALVIGAIKPTNTWDFYTYLVLGAVVLAYAVWRYADTSRLPLDLPDWMKRLAMTLGALVVLVGGSMLLYEPYSKWYLLDAGYTKVYPWTGGRSDISSYLVHWGVFLFFIVSFMVWETRQWLAETPLSYLRKLRPYLNLIIAGIVILLALLAVQQAWIVKTTLVQAVPWRGISIIWLALPLAVWAAILMIFRPGISEPQRLVMFMVGTGLLLSMVVEIIVLGGDINRMNTVFKLYNQAWVLLGLSAAACFGWLVGQVDKWYRFWRISWSGLATVLVAGAGLFLLMGGTGKVDDRMTPSAPHTLDSMTFMKYSVYDERGVVLDLSADYRAIEWMQDNVKGSPVIAEAPGAGIQYEWLNRFSIYTGLPDVIGWQWHQQQQRVVFNSIVIDRAVEEDNFYATTDITTALDFLRKYNVRYIIVGELEHDKYAPGSNFNVVPAGSPDPLAKFEQYNGSYWHSVYHDGQTVIYEVNQ